MNATLWRTVAELGIERVEAVAAEIDKRSHQVESECISPSKKTVGSHMKPVLLPEKMNDPDCRAFIAHGPAMTKILQRRMLDVLGDEYKPCPKTVLKDDGFPRSWFQLMVPVPNHDVTKNLTSHRMHVDGPQIS